jgi:hypothetical protein
MTPTETAAWIADDVIDAIRISDDPPSLADLRQYVYEPYGDETAEVAGLVTELVRAAFEDTRDY